MYKCVCCRLETVTDKSLADSEKSLVRLTEFVSRDKQFDETRIQLTHILNSVRKEVDGAAKLQQTEQVKQQLSVCILSREDHSRHMAERLCNSLHT